MMIQALYFFIGLLSSTCGQTAVLSVSKYVNKSDTVTITCTVGVVIIERVAISKDGPDIIECPIPPVPCTNLGILNAYSAVQNVAAGITTMTINAAGVSRDTGNWTCQYGTTSMSLPVPLIVGTPLSITNMTELPTAAVIETSCTFPYDPLQISCKLDSLPIVCPYNVSHSNSTCSDPKEAALMITLSLGLTTGSASGLLTVTINNGFLEVSRMGNYKYSFTAKTTQGGTTAATTTTTTTTEKDMSTTQTSAPSTNTSTTDESGTNKQQFVLIISVSVGGGGTVLVVTVGIISYQIYRHSREQKQKTDGVDPAKAPHETQNPAYGVLSTPSKSCDETSTSRIDFCLERNDVTKSGPNKGISNAQIQLSTHTLNQISTSHQDGKDKLVPKKNKIKEAKHREQQTANL